VKQVKTSAKKAAQKSAKAPLRAARPYGRTRKRPRCGDRQRAKGRSAHEKNDRAAGKQLC